jgi:hypothetical protein
LPLDDLTREYDILDVLVEDVILPHLFKCVNGKDVLALSDKRTESFKLSLEHPEAILCWAVPALKGGITRVAPVEPHEFGERRTPTGCKATASIWGRLPFFIPHVAVNKKVPDTFFPLFPPTSDQREEPMEELVDMVVAKLE